MTEGLAFTHTKMGENERRSQLDYILGPKMVLSLTYVRNKVKLCCTWTTTQCAPRYKKMKHKAISLNRSKKGMGRMEAVWRRLKK